jgi:hypothetical protein
MTDTADERFVDLEIRVFPRQEAGYPVEVTLGGEQHFPRGYLAAGVLPWAPSGDPVADGRGLFEALLADGPLREAWAEARGRAPRRRVRLWIDESAAELHTLPWELLREGPVTLSAQADTPFSRYLPIARPWGGPVETRPIRILAAISDPTDVESKYGLPRADVELERRALESAFETVDPGDLRVDYLDPPVTLEKLEGRLRSGDYHVLHYLGHGRFSEKRGQAALYMQDGEGLTRLVFDDDLSSMLARRGIQPRLVFLAACETATRSNAGAFLGLAPKLVSIGVPAVVAMQDLVTVESALKFGQTFYRRLLAHGLVDLAANEARSTLLSAGRPDAAVPVLFMRLKSGRLWRGESGEEGGPAEPGGAPPGQFTTHIGSVTGPVHTGSGDIIYSAPSQKTLLSSESFARFERGIARIQKLIDHNLQLKLDDTPKFAKKMPIDAFETAFGGERRLGISEELLQALDDYLDCAASINSLVDRYEGQIRSERGTHPEQMGVPGSSRSSDTIQQIQKISRNELSEVLERLRSCLREESR